MLGPSTNCLCLASSFSSCLSFYAIFFSNLWSLFNSTVAFDTLFEILRASISFLVNLPVLSTSLFIVFSVILPLAIPYTCPSVSSIVASDFCFSIVSSPLVTGELIHDYSVFPNCNSFAGATSLVYIADEVEGAGWLTIECISLRSNSSKEPLGDLINYYYLA